MRSIRSWRRSLATWRADCRPGRPGPTPPSPPPEPPTPPPRSARGSATLPVSERPNRRAAVLKAASLHYEDRLTMDVIAAELELSRATVSRMIGEAREIGLVEITVHHQ